MRSLNLPFISSLLTFATAASVPKTSIRIPLERREVSSLHRRATTAASGSEGLISSGNTFWYGNISIGTPPVVYTVDFDTGSTPFYVPSSKCTNCGPNQHVYDSTKSSTSRDLNKTFHINYVDGSHASGVKYADTVSLAGLAAINQEFGAALEYTSGMAHRRSDGMMGLGWAGRYDPKPFLYSLKEQGVITAKQFAFKLASSAFPDESEIQIGGYNKALLKGEIAWVNTTSESWRVLMGSVNAGSISVARGERALVDTGTTEIYGGWDAVSAIYSQIPGSYFNNTRFHFPCDAQDPKISFTFNNQTLPFPFALLKRYKFGKMCTGSITPHTIASNNTHWTLGDHFLRSVYTIFDMDKAQIGFAQLAGEAH